MQIAIRVLCYILATFLIFMGANKFFADVPIFEIIEAHTGLGFVEPGFKYLTGILEFAAAGLLVFGQRFLGGLLATAITAGAALSHMTVLGISTPEAGFPAGVTAETFQCGVDGVSCSPALFILALVSAAASAFIAFGSKPGQAGSKAEISGH